MERILWKAKEAVLKFQSRTLEQILALAHNTQLQVQFDFLAFKRSVWVKQSSSFQTASSVSSDGSSVLQQAVERHGTHTAGMKRIFEKRGRVF